MPAFLRHNAQLNIPQLQDFGFACATQSAQVIRPQLQFNLGSAPWDAKSGGEHNNNKPRINHHLCSCCNLLHMCRQCSDSVTQEAEAHVQARHIKSLALDQCLLQAFEHALDILLNMFCSAALNEGCTACLRVGCRASIAGLTASTICSTSGAANVCVFFLDPLPVELVEGVTCSCVFRPISTNRKHQPTCHRIVSILARKASTSSAMAPVSDSREVRRSPCSRAANKSVPSTWYTSVELTLLL